jgi:hypothetical protein
LIVGATAYLGMSWMVYDRASSKSSETVFLSKCRIVSFKQKEAGSEIRVAGSQIWQDFLRKIRRSSHFRMTCIGNPGSRLVRHANQWWLCSWLMDRNRWFLRRDRGFDARRPFPGYCMWLGPLISFWKAVNLVVSTIDSLTYRWDKSSSEAGMRPRNERNSSWCLIPIMFPGTWVSTLDSISVLKLKRPSNFNSIERSSELI